MISLETPGIEILRAGLPPGADLDEGLTIVNRLALEWGVQCDSLLPGANYCLVAAGRDDAGCGVVLRVPLCEEESGPGFHAQLAFSGRGGVTVLKQDDQTGSTMMPRLMPGTMLYMAGLDPAKEVVACCDVIRRFGSQQLPEAIPIESWYEPFLATDSAEMIPDDLLKEAQRIAGDLLSTANDRVLLHCDLHHYNLLLHGDEWLAIDPKGVMGDPYLEPAAFLRNPIGVDPDAVLQATRIQTFADLLGLKAARIQAWGVVHNVLSAWWCEPLDRQHTIRIVEAIRAAPI